VPERFKGYRGPCGGSDGGGPEYRKPYYAAGFTSQKSKRMVNAQRQLLRNAAIVHWPTLIVQWPNRPLTDLVACAFCRF
jgi:hypothetical protein